MRWDRLFDDIESQLERELAAEELDLAAEDERVRLARLGLRDRLLALRDADPDAARMLTLIGGSRVAVHLADLGRDWLAGTVDGGSGAVRAVVIPLAAIAAVTLSPADAVASTAAASTAPGLAARLGLPFVLRDLCRRRVAVDLTAGGQWHGTIDRVARDHVDLAVHDPGVPRRASTVAEVRVIAMPAIELVRYAVSAPRSRREG